MDRLRKLLEGLFIILSGVGFGATYLAGLSFFMATNNHVMTILGAIGFFFILVAMKVGEENAKKR